MKQKFLLASVIALLLSLTTKAQIGKGSLWLGGGIGFNSSKEYDDTSTYNKIHGYSVNPAIGKAISENTIVGIDLSYSHNETESKSTNYYTSKVKTDSYGAGIFIRRYVPIISRLYIFGHARAGVGFSKETDTYQDNVRESKTWGPSLNFTPGISFAVNKKLQLETGLNNLFYIGYSHSKITYTPTTGGLTNRESNSFSANASVSGNTPLYIGIRFLINNKG